MEVGMSDGTKIDWCDATIQPVVGCDNSLPCAKRCYAKRLAHRLGGNPKTPQYAGLTESMQRSAVRKWYDLPKPIHWTGEVRFNPAELTKPSRWRKARTIFVTSMGDLFHKAVKEEWLGQVLAMIYGSPQHTFVFLTKRERNMRSRLAAYYAECLPTGIPYPNLALGVSCSTQAEVDQRVLVLRDTPAACRFVSLEPMLEAVDLGDWLPWHHQDCGLPELSGIILGAETGPGARSMAPDWARRVRDDCAAAGVPFFLKQLDAKKNRVLDGRTHDDLPWEVRWKSTARPSITSDTLVW